MSRLTVDSSTLAKPQGLAQPMDLCDEHGRVLGRFVPYPGEVSADDLEIDISEAEFDRRAANFQGRELADLIAQWERRE